MAVAADVLQNGLARDLPTLSGPEAEAVRVLWTAASGVEGNRRLPAAERRTRLTQALAQLSPYLQVMMLDEAQRDWVATQITPYIERLTRSVDQSVAEERVAAFARGEVPDLGRLESADLATKKRVMHQSVRKLNTTLIQLNEQVLRLSHQPHGHAKVHGELERLEHLELPPQVHGKASSIGVLENIQAVLWELDALLTLSDPELVEELREPHGALGTIANVTELLKVAIEIVGGVMPLTFSFAAIVARLNGQVEWAVQASEMAKHSLHVFADIIAAVEVVHGVAVLLSNAPAERKEEAVGSIAIGGSWLALRGLGAIGARAALKGAAGGTVGALAGLEGAGALAGPVSTAIMISWWELKLMAHLYGEARTGIITGWLSAAFQTMKESFKSIADDATMLADAALLAEFESESRQREMLRVVERQWAETTGRDVDGFLERCKPTTYGPGAAYEPGSFIALRKHFAPLLPLMGARTPEAAAAAAAAVLKAIGWCFQHAEEIVAEETGYPLRRESEHQEAGHE